MKEGGMAHLRVSFLFQKGYFLCVVIRGDDHAKAIQMVHLDMVTCQKIGNQLMQTDAYDKP